MKTRPDTLKLSLILAGSLFVGSVAQAQSFQCPPASNASQALQIYVTRVAGDNLPGAAAIRAAIGSPTVPAKNVVVVSDSLKCMRVTHAVDSAFHRPPSSTSLVVVQFGVNFAAHSAGSAGAVVVVDSTYTFKKALTGF